MLLLLFFQFSIDLEQNHLSAFRSLSWLILAIPLCLPPLLPSTHLSGGIFLALLHSFLLNCQAAAAAAPIPTLLPLSARNLVLLATPPLSCILHMVNPTFTSLCVRARCAKHTPYVRLFSLLYLCVLALIPMLQPLSCTFILPL